MRNPIVNKHVTQKIKANTKALTTSEKHQLKIAKDTMKLSCLGARCFGSVNHYDAASIIHKLTGAIVPIDADCTCREAVQ